MASLDGVTSDRPYPEEILLAAPQTGVGGRRSVANTCLIATAICRVVPMKSIGILNVHNRSTADILRNHVHNIALHNFGRYSLTDITYGQDVPLMPRIFAYVRVSTAGQTTENQVHEIAAAGFAVDRKRAIVETVSGSLAIDQRPGFLRLLDHFEAGDVLVVTKLDPLGRYAIDVSQTARFSQRP